MKTCRAKGKGELLKIVRPAQNQAVASTDSTPPNPYAQGRRSKRNNPAKRNPNPRKRFTKNKVPVPGFVSKTRNHAQERRIIARDKKWTSDRPMNMKVII